MKLPHIPNMRSRALQSCSPIYSTSLTTEDIAFAFPFQETDILGPHIHLSLNKCSDYIQARAQQKLLGLN